MEPGLRSALLYVIEPEPASGEALSLSLRRTGFNVLSLPNDVAAREAFSRQLPDILIIDANALISNGVVFREWLLAQSEIPLLVILKPGQVPSASEFNLKVEQFLIEPIQPKELLDRVNLLLTRAGGAPASVLEFSGLKIDSFTRSVSLHSKDVKLTIKEFELLWYFASHPGQAFTRDQLLNAVWGHAEFIDPETVTVHIHRLRAKIEDDPSNPHYIQTVYGKGYKFEV